MSKKPNNILEESGYDIPEKNLRQAYEEIKKEFENRDKPPQLIKLENYIRFYMPQETPKPIELLSKLDEFGFKNLDSIQLAKLPEPFKSLVNLQELNLSRNKLTKLPESIGALVNLQKLNLSGNILTELPESFGSLVKLQILFLSKNKLTELPENFGALVNLQRLSLTGNKLTELPENFGSLVNLQKLYLENNNLTKLPENFGSLVNLQLLALENNNLTKLSESFGSLANLQRLNLDNNNLTKLPESFGSLVKLQILFLSKNKLTELPESFGSLVNLQELDLNNNNLTKLPESFGSLVNLQSLSLKDNNLTKLPDSFGSLVNIQLIHIENNELTELPLSIGLLTNLRILDLNNNKLTELPESFGPLINLKELILESNELTKLPLSIGSLTNLQNLYLSKNKLTELPVSIGSLTNLRMIYLGHNELTELPLSLGQCENLTTIEIEGTQISEQQRNTILQQCQKLRDKNAPEVLLLRVQSWKNRSQREFDLSGIKDLDEKNKEVLNEWLVRLENTRDFNSKSQKILCKIVCEMLEGVVKEENKEFAELFFSQVEANNECCQDRAAMALNEIYTSWKITTLDKNSSDKEKLELMTRGAKTLALRAAIANYIERQQKENKTIERESVEIYLYYETALKEKLNLLSAIDSMAYKAVGKRDWINEEDLINKIEETYLDYLIEFPSFDKMVQSNKSYNKLYEKKGIGEMDEEIEKHFDKKPNDVKELLPEALEKLTETEKMEYEKDFSKYLDWNTEYGILVEKRKKPLAEMKKEWVLKNLKPNEKIKTTF